MDTKKFGTFIAQHRKENQMTQTQLAEKLYVTDKAVSRWERGLGFPDINTLEPLAEALGVSVPELMRSEKSQKPSFLLSIKITPRQIHLFIVIILDVSTYFSWVLSLPATEEEQAVIDAGQEYTEGRFIGGFDSRYVGPGETVEEKITSHFEVTLEHLHSDPSFPSSSTIRHG